MLVVVAVLVATVFAPSPAWGDTVAPTRVTLAFVGDVLPHLSLVGSAYDPGTGRYDFRPVFAPVAPFLNEADLTVANLETRFAGSWRGYQGYPGFNSPDELARDLASSGVDTVGTANNHALDMGFEGLVRTLDVLDAVGLGHVGTARSAAEAEVPCVVDVRGVRVALLNYTDYTNGLPLPSGRPWALGMLTVAAVKADAARARSVGAELVVAFLHWGDEYTRYPSAGRRDLAAALLDAGVDAIVGSHPHMVQPVSRVRSPSGREGFVAWSLGNFVSDQRLRYRDAGLVLYLDVVEDAAGARVTGVRYLPSYVQKTWAGGRSRFRVLPVHPDIPLDGDLGLSSDDRRRMDQVWHETVDHLAGVPGVSVYQPPAYAEAAQALVERGIMQGYASGDLGLHDPAWRQQFAKMVALALRLPVSEGDACPFTDVEAGGPGTLYPDDYIAAVARAGIVRGVAPGLFTPREPVSRIQAVSMVVRGLDTIEPGVVPPAPAGFTCTWSDDLEGESLGVAVRAEAGGLLAGLPVAGLDPWAPMTRGELAQLVWNAVRR